MWNSSTALGDVVRSIAEWRKTCLPFHPKPFLQLGPHMPATLIDEMTVYGLTAGQSD